LAAVAARNFADGDVGQALRLARRFG